MTHLRERNYTVNVKVGRNVQTCEVTPSEYLYHLFEYEVNIKL